MHRFGWTLSFLLLTALTLGACQPVMPVEADTPVVATESVDIEPEATESAWDEIFDIRSWAYGGFDQYKEFVCHIGDDCANGGIPEGLYRGDEPFPQYPQDAPKLTIVFQLDRDYSELILHLGRAGSETTAVSVDGEEPQLVTADLLGSRDGGTVGSYDLQLGSLQRGSHAITFSIPDDGKGNGTYSWRRLSLTAR